MPVYDKYNFLLLPKMLVLNPKDGTAPAQGLTLMGIEFFD